MTEEDIPDENFRKCLETDTPDSYNNWSETRELNLYNLIRIRLLHCGGQKDPDLGVIVSIKGIEYLKNLTNLELLLLDDAKIVDLTPSSNLTKLKYLWLNKNYIEDISPLNSLVNLDKLVTSLNCIRDCYNDCDEYNCTTHSPQIQDLIDLEDIVYPNQDIRLHIGSQLPDFCEQQEYNWDEFLENRN